MNKVIGGIGIGKVAFEISEGIYFFHVPVSIILPKMTVLREIYFGHQLEQFFLVGNRN
jgi:hypothetical protein